MSYVVCTSYTRYICKHDRETPENLLVEMGALFFFFFFFFFPFSFLGGFLDFITSLPLFNDGLFTGGLAGLTWTPGTNFPRSKEDFPPTLRMQPAPSTPTYFVLGCMYAQSHQYVSTAVR